MNQDRESRDFPFPNCDRLFNLNINPFRAVKENTSSPPVGKKHG